MAIETIINFDNPINFNFDQNYIKFESGKASLKDLRPTGGILHHSFNDEIENWGASSFDMVLSSASISGDRLHLTQGQRSYATSQSGGLSGFGNKGSILIRVNFGFTGNPSSTLRIFRILNGNDVSNLIELLIDTSGIWRVNLKDSFGNSLASSVAVGSFQIAENKDYEIAWVFDTILGYHRLFVDGVASTTTLAYTYTRNGSLSDVMQLGHNLNAAPYNASFDSVTIFNTIYASGDYHPFVSISPTVYKLGYSAITNSSAFLTDSILAFDFIANASNVSCVANVSGVKKYFDGVAWVNSSSPSQSSALETIRDNITSLDISNGANITFTVYLLSDGNTNTDITQLYASYDFDFIAKTPNRCTVYGAVIGADNRPISGAVVSLVGADFLNGETIVVNRASARSDASGQFELSTFETETSNTPVSITISYKSGKIENTFTFENKIIPKVDSIPISDL